QQRAQREAQGGVGAAIRLRERQRFRRERANERLREQQHEQRNGAGVAQPLCRVARAEQQDAGAAVEAPLQPRTPEEHDGERREDAAERQPAHQSAAITACVTSRVRALPPRSGVRIFCAVTFSIARMMRAAARASPRCSSMSDAVQNVAIGLATPLPVMSNAEPWIGSNIDRNLRSGLRFAVGAVPGEPESAAARSERMSACRFDATTVSMAAGLSTMRVVIASTRTRSVFTSG